jgi:hypothetical protein
MTMTAAIQRPGWRSGIALIGAGSGLAPSEDPERPDPGEAEEVTLSPFDE